MNTRLNTSTHDWVNRTDFYQHKLYHMRKLRVKFFLLRSNAQTKIARRKSSKTAGMEASRCNFMSRSFLERPIFCFLYSRSS